MGTATIPAKGGDQERGDLRPGEARGVGQGVPASWRPAGAEGPAASWARSTTTASA